MDGRFDDEFGVTINSPILFDRGSNFVTHIYVEQPNRIAHLTVYGVNQSSEVVMIWPTIGANLQLGTKSEIMTSHRSTSITEYKCPGLATHQVERVELIEENCDQFFRLVLLGYLTDDVQCSHLPTAGGIPK